MTHGDVREIKQRRPVRLTRVHHFEYGLKVAIEIDGRARATFEGQRLVPVIPPSVGDAARELRRLAAFDGKPLTADLHRERAGRDQAFFILEVMNVHGWARSMRGQRASKFKDKLPLAPQSPNLEDLAGMPVLQSQSRRGWGIRRHRCAIVRRSG